MKLLAIYFTGTYNSKKVLDKVCNELINQGNEVDVVDACCDEVKDINMYDAMVISYPIYAFNAPLPIIKYVKKLACANKPINCLVVKNSGEYSFLNNASSLKLASILKKKNIYIKNEYHYLMPYSFVFRHSDYMVWKMKQAVDLFVPQDVNAFLCGNEQPIKRFFLDRPFSFIFRIQRFGGRFNGRFYKVDLNKCSHCNKCINNCPANNIMLKDGAIEFGKNCLMCQRCAMYCPTQAISVGLFKRWQVGKAYAFKEQLEYQKELKPRFCVRSYKRYFGEYESRAKVGESDE